MAKRKMEKCLKSLVRFAPRVIFLYLKLNLVKTQIIFYAQYLF